MSDALTFDPAAFVELWRRLGWAVVVSPGGDQIDLRAVANTSLPGPDVEVIAAAKADPNWTRKVIAYLEAEDAARAI